MAAEGSNSIDALGQFQLHSALGPIGASVNFTQANLMMVVAGLAVMALLWMGMKPRAMVPGTPAGRCRDGLRDHHVDVRRNHRT